MEEAHRAECIHGNVLQWPPQLNFSPWVNLTDQALSWSVFKYMCRNKQTNKFSASYIHIHNYDWLVI